MVRRTKAETTSVDSLRDLDAEEVKLRKRLAEISDERTEAIKAKALTALDVRANLTEAIYQNRILIAALAGHSLTHQSSHENCGICRMLALEVWELPTQGTDTRAASYQARDSLGVDLFISVAAYDRASGGYVSYDGDCCEHKEPAVDYKHLDVPEFAFVQEDDNTWYIPKTGRPSTVRRTRSKPRNKTE